MFGKHRRYRAEKERANELSDLLFAARRELREAVRVSSEARAAQSRAERERGQMEQRVKAIKEQLDQKDFVIASLEIGIKQLGRDVANAAAEWAESCDATDENVSAADRQWTRCVLPKPHKGDHVFALVCGLASEHGVPCALARGHAGRCVGSSSKVALARQMTRPPDDIDIEEEGYQP